MKNIDKNILRSLVLKASLIAGALMLGVTGANAWTTSPMLWQGGQGGGIYRIEGCGLTEATCAANCVAVGMHYTTKAEVEQVLVLWAKDVAGVNTPMGLKDGLGASCANNFWFLSPDSTNQNIYGCANQGTNIDESADSHSLGACTMSGTQEGNANVICVCAP